MKVLLAGILTVCVASITTASHAAVPTSINYQGKLYTNGLPYNGQVSVSIGIYSNDTGGTATYTEAIGAVAVTNGLYSFPYGADTTNFYSALDAAEAWLEVVLNGAPLTPRQRLVAVPYAHRAGSVSEQSLALPTDEAIEWLLSLQGQIDQLRSSHSLPVVTNHGTFSETFATAAGYSLSVNLTNTTAYHDAARAAYINTRLHSEQLEKVYGGGNGWEVFKTFYPSTLVAAVENNAYIGELNQTGYCCVVYTYTNATTASTATNALPYGSAPSFPPTYANPNPELPVAKIEVRAISGSLGSWLAEELTRVFERIPVEVTLDLPPFIHSSSAAAISFLGSKNPVDALTYRFVGPGGTSTLFTSDQRVAIPAGIAPTQLHVLLENNASPGDPRSTLIQGITIKVWP